MKTINFMGQRTLAMLFSAVLLLGSIGSLATKQLNWGLDFTGGTLVEVHYSETANLNAIRSTLDAEGYSGAIVVSFGTDRDVMIRLPKGYLSRPLRVTWNYAELNSWVRKWVTNCVNRAVWPCYWRWVW